jgi:hypothetical protein
MTDRLKSRELLTQTYALECFEYRDGELFWRTRPATHFVDVWRQRIFNSRQAGTKAGSICSGYLMVNFGFGKVSVHRLVYLMHHGNLPKEIDHIDGNKTNNKIENLRVATHSQNLRNVGISSANTSGHKGVSLHKASGKWAAHIRVDGKMMHLGLFSCAKDAAAARRDAEIVHYGRFRRG